MQVAYNCFLILIISFVGSLPLGIISIAVCETTLSKGKLAGKTLSYGATLFQVVYSFIIFSTLHYIGINEMYQYYLELLAMFIFFVLGGYYLIKKSRAYIVLNNKATSSRAFFKGVVVGLMAVTTPLFWLIVGVFLLTKGLVFEQAILNLMYAISAGIGALSAFLLYVNVSYLLLNRSQVINRYLNPAIGLIFIGLGVIQLFHIVA